jgi:hypothetical protein
MNKTFTSLATGAALAVTLAGCSKNDKIFIDYVTHPEHRSKIREKFSGTPEAVNSSEAVGARIMKRGGIVTVRIVGRDGIATEELGSGIQKKIIPKDAAETKSDLVCLIFEDKQEPACNWEQANKPPVP